MQQSLTCIPSARPQTVPSSEASTADQAIANGKLALPYVCGDSAPMTQGGVPKMAGLSDGNKSTQPHPPRPSIHSHHSSSVPSTPYQQPRDLRFHSRSPSPNRGLSNQSPRSVLSEAPGPSTVTVQKSAPVVCKFETGAEIRKRRIPYVDGGNEELGPPKKEPKKTLDPVEDKKLFGDMRELYDRLLPSEESEERRVQLVKKLERILNDEWPSNEIRVNVFGSSGNLLSSSDSDVDICITTPLKKLETMHAIAMLLDKNGMEKVVCRASAKVPIVKCWDPELKLAADLNVNNPLALENTRMIKTYVQLDDRIRPLAKIIKCWTKRRILNDAAFGGTISSYTWICMIINFLQRRDPPILPSLQKIAGRRQKRDDRDKSQFADDVNDLKGCGDANKETLAELLFQFFRHYGYEFDYSKYVVSVKEGRLLSRKEKGWDPSNYQDKEARNRLCVEEPFTTNRNLGNSADDYAWSGIHGEIRRAFELLADGCQLEKCCEQYEFPPEEKPIFQRPAPKPKPTLTRSASQSGRSHHEPGSGRSRKSGNRNQSAQRAGNRRASSGASFSNQRVPFTGITSPLHNSAMMDYFAATAKGDLHSQLYQQYQYLQAQQDALRSQLVQAAQSQSHGRAGDLAATAFLRYQNGLPSPRLMDQSPQTAPLPMTGVPAGSLWHYPNKYPPQGSPLSQSRTRDGGTSTNPSSPSLVAAVPALRRQMHRGPVPDGSSSAMRSQSQPGRSLPHPLTLQQQAHPGYDVSGALPGQYQNVRPYPQGPPPMPLPFSPIQQAYPPSAAVDSAMPKEYVGYYVGQSPSLGPQYATSNQMPLPPMTLRDPPPQRQRKITPELMPPLANGKHSSRSPSPLAHGHPRSYSTSNDQPQTQPTMVSSPPVYDITPTMAPIPLRPVQADTKGPVIVNGSGPASALKQSDKLNGIPPVPPIPKPYAEEASRAAELEFKLSRVQSLPLQPTLDTAVASERSEPKVAPIPCPAEVTTPRLKPSPKLTLSPNGTPHGMNGTSDHYHESTPVTIAPLLSPVAEMRTPSPTHSLLFDKESPTATANGGLMKAAKIASARQADNRENDRPVPVSPTAVRHERKGSAPNPTVSKPARSPTFPAPVTSVTSTSPTATGPAAVNQNTWQTATRKGHRKSKSTAGGGNLSGQALPLFDGERKGG